MRKVTADKVTAALQGNVLGGVGTAALGGDSTRSTHEQSAHGLPRVIHNVDKSGRGKDVPQPYRPAKQQLLGLVAPGRTIGQARFMAETRRRGGPYEVQGKRWRS